MHATEKSLIPRESIYGYLEQINQSKCDPIKIDIIKKAIHTYDLF